MSSIDIIQAASAKSNSGSTAPVTTFASTPVNGHTMLAVIAANEQPGDVTIGLGAWTLLGTLNDPGKELLSVYKRTAGASEPTTVGASLSASRRWVMWIAELDDTVVASLLDGSPGLNSGGSLTFVSATLNTTFPDERWFAFFAAKTHVSMSFPTNLFNERLNSGTTGNAANDVTLGIYDKDVSATGAAQVSVTSDSNVAYVSIILAIKSVPSSVTYNKTGSVVSARAASAGDAHTAPRAGQVISPKVASGARANVGLSKAGIVISDAPGGNFGRDNFGTRNFGVGGEQLAGVAVKATGQKTGTVSCGGSVLSGTGHATIVKTGLLVSALSALGPDASTHQETGLVISARASSGSSIRFGPGKSGICTCNAFATSGPDATTHVEAGMVVSARVVSGGDAHTATKTGRVVMVNGTGAAGHTEGEPRTGLPAFDRPYNVPQPVLAGERYNVTTDHERSY